MKRPSFERRRPLIAAIILMMLLIALVPMADGGESISGSKASTFVEYHLYKPDENPEIDAACNSTAPQTGDSIPSITVRYDGVVSTEYNPQKWKGTIKGTVESGDDSNWYPIEKYETGKTVVFAGWVYLKDTGTQTSYSSQDGTGYYPGEVLDDSSLYSSIDGKIHVYATWAKLENYLNIVDSLSGSTTVNDSTVSSWKGGNPFTNILELSEGSYVLQGRFTKPLTITGSGERTSTTLGSQVSLSEDCIIDNMAIRNSKETGGNHGYGTNVGLYANGNNLIMGTGLSASLSGISKNPHQYLLQVIGGSYNGNVAKTNVIIHSGYYYTVIAGNQDGRIEGDTRMTIRGGIVLDTVVGGCSGAKGEVGGSTHVYLIGDAVMPGDYYEEKSLDENYSLVIGKEIENVESSILTGGSNKSLVNGSTYVHISNNAQAWDVQGAGRGGLSTVKDTANVHVSGNALVKHVVNGSITDGLNGNSGDSSPSNKANECVKNTNIVISDNAKVASVFGAGYDTFYASNYSSMYNKGTISITIEGGTVGYVYGGGYRGSIGIENNRDSTESKPIESITIDIRGGTVLYDVFGGGRGGLDKVCHSSDGSINWGSSQNDTVGHSRVYAEKISIIVRSEARVNGNVYGGGESTPVITSYDGVSKPYNNQSLGGNGDSKVASVVCDAIELKIEGTVGGSVYGAGKGVDLSDTVDGRHSTAYIFAMDSEGSMNRIPWIKGNGGATEYSSGFDDFACVTSKNITVHIGKGSSIEGSVYGGGAYSRTVADLITVSVLGGEVTNVHGGGLGSPGSLSTKANRKIAISGGIIRGSVYGSSSLGDDGSPTDGFNVVIAIDGGETHGSVYGGGYKGTTYGNISMDLGGNAVIGESVYGGADIGTTSDSRAEWSRVLVHGNSTISVDGSAGLRIGMSIFGSGNSCLVDGTKKVTISRFVSDSDFESLQNIDELAVYGSDITLTGRVDGTSAQASTKYSLSNIGRLSLVDGTDLDFEASLNDLGSYGSYVTNGDVLSPTTESSPKNSIRLSDGVVFEVKTSSASDTQYGIVEGYTILSIHVSELYYGALAYGSKDSLNGGFMVLGNGTLIKASTTVFDDCFCWYIAGAVRYTTTAVAYSDSGTQSSKLTVHATLPKMSNTTSIVYVGHSTYQTRPGSLNLVDELGSSSDFRLTMGGPGGNMTFDDGVPITGHQMSVDPIEGTMEAGGGSSIPRIAYELEFLKQNYTGYIGSIHFSYWEAVDAEINGVAKGYILQNRIDVELEIYTESSGEGFGSSEDYQRYDAAIHTVDGNGSSVFVIPRSFHDYEVTLDRAVGAPIGRMTVTPVYNEERTLGWVQPMQGDVTLSSNSYIGELKGSFHASIDIRVYGSSGNEDATLYFTMKSPSGDVRKFCLNVRISPSASYNVTFIDDVMNPESSTVISVIAGGRISNSLVPLTGDHFIGWFLDDGYNRLFNLNTPITHDIVLHALYRYAVTFDLMNGQRFVDYVDMSQSTALSNPSNPTWDGYTFEGWLKDVDGKRVKAFEDGYEIISEDTTFYADWKGNAVRIEYNLNYPESSLTDPIFMSTRDFGSTYGEDLIKATEKAMEELSKHGMKFVRWKYADSFAYSDTTLYSSKDHVLVADYAVEALQVTLSKGETESGFFDEPVINAPVSFLVYEMGGRFAFIPSNATTTGYYLSGWTFVAGLTSITVPAGAEIVFKRQGESFVYEDGGRTYTHSGVLELDAEWEPLLYEVGIQEPIGGDIRCDADDLSKLKYGQSIRFVYEPNPALPYTLESWMVSGECSYTVSGNEMVLTVHGNCYVSVRLGGMYDVSVTLRMDGSADTEDRGLTLVSATGDRRSLKWENGRYTHSAVEAGAYSLVMKDGAGTVVIDERVNVLKRTELSYDLYTISVACEPSLLSDRLSYPGFSIPGRQVEILFDEGYEASASGIEGLATYSDRIVFTMPAEAVSIEVALTEKTIEVSLDYGGGTDKNGEADGSVTVGYYGKYDFSSLGVTRENYELMHWADDRGRQYTDGSAIDPEVVSLTAVWKNKDDVAYSVVLRYQNIELTGYDEGEMLTYYGTGATIVSYHPPARSGFIRPGTIDILISEGAGPTYIDYIRMEYTVTVEVQGCGVQTKEMVFDAPLSRDAADIGNGYDFAGWFSDEAMTLPVSNVPAFDGECRLYVKTVPKTYTILYRDGITGGLHEGVSSSYVYGEEDLILGDDRLEKEGFHISRFVYDGDAIESIGRTFVDDHPGQIQFIVIVEWIPDMVSVTIHRPAVGDIYADGSIVDFEGPTRILAIGYGSKVTLEYKSGSEALYAWAVGGDVAFGAQPLVLQATHDISVAAVIEIRADDALALSVSWSVVRGSGTIENGRMVYTYGAVPLEDFGSSCDGIEVRVSGGVLSMACDPAATGTVLLPRLMPSDGSFILSVELHIIGDIVDVESAGFTTHAQIFYLYKGSGT